MAREIRFRYFGMIAEKIGKDSEFFSTEEITADIRAFLKTRYPGIENYAYSIAADLELVDEVNLETVSEISILPPFAGG